jgi:hypothetical protein
MISEEDARRIVENQFGRGTRYSLYPFSRGWVASLRQTVDTRSSVGGPPSSPGAANFVVDNRSGEVVQQGSQPVRLIAEWYSEEHP